MPRTIPRYCPGLLALILSWPAGRAMAGPIITHPIESAGSGS